MTTLSPSFAHLLKLTVTTKRLSQMKAGSAGTAGAYLTSLKITQPVALSTPVSARNDVTMQSPILGEPYELLQAFAGSSPDVKKGDILVIGGKDYPVAFVEDWPFEGDQRVRIMLEKPDTR